MKFEDFINKQVAEDARNQQRDNLALFKKKQQELFNLQMDPATQIYEEQIKQKLSALNEWAKSQGILENTTPLSIGDPVIITGDVEFNGSTGEIESFGKDNNFVVVNLYNHGRHSFQSSDVEYNEYADSDDEEARAYDNDMDARNWNTESVAEASWDRKDAYERDYEHSIAGMGKRQSYAYSQDGGANDEGDDSIDAKIRADYEKKKQYEQTGKFWLKQKDTQQHINDTHYTGKSAANSAALELLKQRPELKGNLVITAYGPDEKNESVVNELTGWTQAPRTAQKRTTKPAAEYKGNTDKRSELQRSKDAGNKNWFKMKETGNAPQQRVVEGSKPSKTELAMAYLKAVVMAPTGTPENERIRNWQEELADEFDIEMNTAVLAKMLPQLDNMLQLGKLDKLQNRMASRGELYIESAEQDVAEGYYDLNDDGMQPIDLSANPSLKELMTRHSQLYYQGMEDTTTDEEMAEQDAIEQYALEKFGQKGLDSLNTATQTNFWGRKDGRGSGGYRGDNLGRASAPGGSFRTTKSGVMHKQDTKMMKNKVAARLGRHPEPNLPESADQSVTEVSKATLDQYVPKAVDAHGHADFSARMSKDDPTKRSYHVDQKRTAEKRRQGISRALDRMPKMEGVEKSTDELYGLRVGDTVKAVINGKRVQGDVIDIFPETMEVELLLRGANAGRTVTVDVRDTEFMNEQGVAENVTHKGGEVSHKGTVTRHKAGPGVYGGSEYDTDLDTEIDKNFINRSEKTMGIKWPREKKYQGSINVTEATDDSPVVNAITRRILLQRADLLSKYGLDAVVDAIDEVADFVGDVEEIGSSDVSGWVKHVEQMLGNMEEGVAEADNKIADRHDSEDFDAMVTRLRKLAGQGELKTVWDPVKRVYKNVPVSQEKK